MRKTFMLQLPNEIGVLLEADRRITEIGLNITRLSYNRVVDMHMLFLEADGTAEQLARAEEALARLGYLQTRPFSGSVVLFEFELEDKPGRLIPVLELAAEFRFEISYVNSYENGTGYQPFQIGLVISDPERLPQFLRRASRICPVRVVDYDDAAKLLDNSAFYRTFATDIATDLGLSEEDRDRLVIWSNRIMQILDVRGETPYRTFESIRICAHIIARHRGDGFDPRVTRLVSPGGQAMTLVEPPCGSNVCVFDLGDELLAVDSGLACFAGELEDLLRACFPRFDETRRTLVLTHADIDHAGGARLFDRVLASAPCLDEFEVESRGEEDVRGRDPVGGSFIGIYKTMTGFKPPERGKLERLGSSDAPHEPGALLWPIGTFEVGPLSFEVFEGAGGHVVGEVVLVERSRRIVFTGDIFINVHGQTKEQARFNAAAAYLMTSVDMSPDLAACERDAVFGLLDPGDWLIVGGHGAGIVRSA